MTDDDAPTDVGPDSVTLDCGVAVVRTDDGDVTLADEHNDVLVPGDSIGDLVDVLEFFDGLREPVETIMPVGGPADNTTGDKPDLGEFGSHAMFDSDDPDADAAECPECGGPVRESLGGKECTDAGCGWSE